MRTISLRVFNLTPDQSFANEDESTIEVHVAPLQPVNLPGAHACEEPDRVVVPEGRPDGVQNQPDLLQREREDVDSGNPETLHLVRWVGVAPPV